MSNPRWCVKWTVTEASPNGSVKKTEYSKYFGSHMKAEHYIKVLKANGVPPATIRLDGH